ncbi:amidohydrolase [Lactonifactor longoviformis]|uniref:Imidazolonepropionase n=1 Tax=Lactonifactor longoviformis DSM 17459 TaxID=1122155 RepID=A0A1M5CWT9_9CLOT|nr:amidohydrolase [Lactonifactor longoviformis]POP31246.1 amidohydrolase [Lactonifactor longoviformis]SHF59146.1 Imidazolonepropionase [Lactonifactor longoviformis DSM 17459]
MLLINGRVLTMAGKVWENGYVRTEGKVIADIGSMDTICVDDSEEVIDACGGWIMPGLIDAHTHIGITEERKGTIGDDCNEITDPITPQLRGLDAVNPMDCAFHDAILAGITSVMAGPGSANVVGGQFVFMKTHGRCIDEMSVLEPAAMKVAFGENPKTNYGDQGQSPATRMAIAAMLREELFRAKQYWEKKKKGKLSEKDFRMEAWIPVLEKKIPMKAHAHRADDILTAIRIAREFDVDITLDHCTEGHLIAEEVAASGFPAIVGTDLTSRSKIEVENMSFKTCGVLEKAGVMVAVTTDHPVTIIRYLPLCAGMAVQQGMSLEGGLKALTIHPAKICRADDRVGSLEVGKDADIAVFTGNPMEVFTETICTVIDGETVYRRE